jgi:hypothetical protein
MVEKQSKFVDQFLKNLDEAVPSKTKLYNRMLCLLWHCYSPDHATQLEFAA